MSTTPRTDEVYDRRLAPEKSGITGHELSKQLETELAAACSLQALACRKLDAAETELAAEREKVRVLRDALERRHTEQGYHRQYVDDVLDATKEGSK